MFLSIVSKSSSEPSIQYLINLPLFKSILSINSKVQKDIKYPCLKFYGNVLLPLSTTIAYKYFPLTAEIFAKLFSCLPLRLSVRSAGTSVSPWDHRSYSENKKSTGSINNRSKLLYLAPNINYNKMVIGIMKEPDFESRISLLPEGVAELKKLNVETWVEKGAGLKAFAADDQYEKAGAKIMARAEILQKSRSAADDQHT